MFEKALIKMKKFKINTLFLFFINKKFLIFVYTVLKKMNIIQKKLKI